MPDETKSPATPEPKRNDPCPCGSGKKFKNCICSDKARLTSHVQGLINRIPREVRIALPYFMNWLMEDLPTLELVAGLSPAAFDTLVLQSVHNKCLLELQARAAKQQATSQGLAQERSSLMNRLAEIDNQQQRISDQSDLEASKRAALQQTDDQQPETKAAEPAPEEVVETVPAPADTPESPTDVSSET